MKTIHEYVEEQLARPVIVVYMSQLSEVLSGELIDDEIFIWKGTTKDLLANEKIQSLFYEEWGITHGCVTGKLDEEILIFAIHDRFKNKINKIFNN